MPPRKKTSPHPALTDTDVTTLRERVKVGEAPRVMVRAASAAVPAGTRGNVVRVGDPSDGEFIVVRLGRDEVPFAPSELAISGRSAGGPDGSSAPRTPTTKRAATTTKAAASRPSRRRSGDPQSSRTGAKAATRPARRTSTSRRATVPLTVTLRFADGAWSVEASRGARRLAKPGPLRPGAVKAFADLVDEPSVRDALTETVESCRAAVEERAAALREQLDATEAALLEYDARRR